MLGTDRQTDIVALFFLWQALKYPGGIRIFVSIRQAGIGLPDRAAEVHASYGHPPGQFAVAYPIDYLASLKAGM